MKTQTKSIGWTLASVAVQDAWTDFMLSRQSMNATASTLNFYRHTAGTFLQWAEEQGVQSPEELSGRLIRQYLAELRVRGRKDTTLHANARAIKTLVRFWHEENYMPELVKFEMPKLEKKRLPVLSGEQLLQVLTVCNVRDKAIVLFMADSGLRRQETCNLNWNDVNMETGLVRVKQGKGQKDRSAMIGATSRRALMRYKRSLDTVSPNSPLFLSRTNGRFSGSGLLIVYRRLTKATGIHVTPHAMRRTFTTLSRRAGMNDLDIMNLGGWTSLDMVDHYAQMVDDDLIREHKAHSPIDNLR